MTTQYTNQSVQYTDIAGNTATLTPDVGLVLSNGVTTLTMDQTGFTNGVQTLLFQDIYTTVGKTESIKFLTSTPTSLNVQDTIVVDKVGFTPTNTIENERITLIGGGLFGNSSLGYDGLSIEDNTNTNSVVTTPTEITLTSGITSNTLDVNNWSGNIQTVNTSANATHYLNFSDSSSTGYGKPQKTTGITVNPSTKTVTATTFVGALTGASSSVLTTSDNTATTCYLPFIKTTAGASTPLYVDDTTGPLSYNPSTSVMTALYFSGDVIRPTTQNTATYSSPTLSISGASNGQNVSYRNSSIIFTGSSNTVSALTLTNMVINGIFNVMILNSGSGNLTFNTTLGTNIKTVYSSSVSIPSGRYGMLSINTIVANSLTIYVVNVVVLTN